MDEEKKNREETLATFSPASHSFNEGVAISTRSIAAATIFNHLFFWLKNNKIRGMHQHEGRTWMYEKISDIALHFGYLSEQQVKDGLNLLVKHGYILKGNFADNRFERTNWYAVTNEDWIEIKKSSTKRSIDPIQQGPQTSSSRSTDQMIYKDTDNNTDNNTDKSIAQTVSRPRKGDPSISFSFEEHKFTNLTQKDIQSWKEIYPDLDILREIKRMQRWALDNPTKSKPKKKLGQIYKQLAEGRTRQADQQDSIQAGQERGCDSETHGLPEGRSSSTPEQNLRLLEQRRGPMHLKWEDAVLRFKIGKVHQVASIDQFSDGMRDLFAKWIASPTSSLYLSGSAGSGKTYASVALLKGLIEKKLYPWIIYKRSHELDDELLEAVSTRQESFVLEKYHEVPFLFIDDLGVERVNDRVIKQYYSIIDHRLNNLLPTVFTSNILRKDIDKNLGDRIASRLQMAAEIIFPKKDYRKGIN